VERKKSRREVLTAMARGRQEAKVGRVLALTKAGRSARKRSVVTEVKRSIKKATMLKGVREKAFR